MKVSLKEWMKKVTNHISKPPIIGTYFGIPPTSTSSGGKTCTVTLNIPSGYAVVPNSMVTSLYISGNAYAYVTDRGTLQINGSTVTFTYYLHNPNGATSLLLCGTVLCYFVGGYCLNAVISRLSAILHRSCLGVM